MDQLNTRLVLYSNPTLFVFDCGTFSKNAMLQEKEKPGIRAEIFIVDKLGHQSYQDIPIIFLLKYFCPVMMQYKMPL
jgi:hypothetical protein